MKGSRVVLIAQICGVLGAVITPNQNFAVASVLLIGMLGIAFSIENQKK